MYIRCVYICAHTKYGLIGKKSASMIVSRSLSESVRSVYLHILFLTMRIVIQKVKRASVTVDSEIVSS